jgi:hypothetical protein
MPELHLGPNLHFGPLPATALSKATSVSAKTSWVPPVPTCHPATIKNATTPNAIIHLLDCLNNFSIQLLGLIIKSFDGIESEKKKKLIQIIMEILFNLNQ